MLPDNKPWEKRKAYLLTPEFSVDGKRYAQVRPNIAKKPDGTPNPGFRPDMKVTGMDAALCFARELTREKLGPAPRGKRFDVFDSGFAVRNTDALPGCFFIVEGPPNEVGALPEWGNLEHRKQVPVKDTPHVLELVESVEG